jgi:membrane protein YqaA with SNARE-associated domain
MLALLKPLGVWGVCALAIVDSSSIPMPIDAIVIGYVAADHKKFVIYAFMAALGSAIGSLVPYYIGRAGGELFLLKRVNRERFDRMRDRFERQEFLAIFLPAMGPPPTPIKLFEFCAGVFEMKPAPFLLAIFLGKLVQFTIYAIITHYFGASAMSTVMAAIHEHAHLVLTIAGLLVALIGVWLVRKLFDRKKGAQLPIEEEISPEESTHTIVEE